MVTLYTNKVQAILQRMLTSAERDTVSQFFEAGYSVNYTAEYLR